MVCGFCVRLCESSWALLIWSCGQCSSGALNLSSFYNSSSASFAGSPRSALCLAVSFCISSYWLLNNAPPILCLLFFFNFEAGVIKLYKQNLNFRCSSRWLELIPPTSTSKASGIYMSMSPDGKLFSCSWPPRHEFTQKLY